MIPPFKNRKHAGILLGEILQSKVSGDDVLVLGIPRGGVEVAYYVAKTIGANFSIVISKKLSYPDFKEIAFGAMAEDLSVFLTEQGKKLPPEVIMEEIDKQLDEIKRRVMLYRKGLPLPLMEDKTVILVDDGIATGSTLVPLISMCKKQKAKKVIIAAPVSGNHVAPELYDLSDEVFVGIKPKSFSGVSAFYEDFKQVSDQEVFSILNTHLSGE